MTVEVKDEPTACLRVCGAGGARVARQRIPNRDWSQRGRILQDRGRLCVSAALLRIGRQRLDAEEIGPSQQGVLRIAGERLGHAGKRPFGENPPGGTGLGTERHLDAVRDVDNRVDDPRGSPVHAEIRSPRYRREGGLADAAGRIGCRAVGLNVKDRDARDRAGATRDIGNTAGVAAQAVGGRTQAAVGVVRVFICCTHPPPRTVECRIRWQCVCVAPTPVGESERVGRSKRDLCGKLGCGGGAETRGLRRINERRTEPHLCSGFVKAGEWIEHLQRQRKVRGQAGADRGEKILSRALGSGQHVRHRHSGRNRVYRYRDVPAR